MAMACRPRLLIGDEPTTALDVTIQAQILALLRDFGQAAGIAVLLISHDLGVMAAMASRVVVMYAGQVVEEAPTRELFREPRHPYTRLLLAVVPGVREKRARLSAIAGSMPAPCRLRRRSPSPVASIRVVLTQSRSAERRRRASTPTARAGGSAAGAPASSHDG